MREPRDGVHRVERRRELREVEARLRLRQADAAACARGSKVRAEVATAGAHRRDEVRFHRVGRGRRGRHQVEIVEAREERARRVVVVVRWDGAAGAVEREERPHLRGDAPGGGDRDPAPPSSSRPRDVTLTTSGLARSARRHARTLRVVGRDAGARRRSARGARNRAVARHATAATTDGETITTTRYRARDGPRTWRNRREPRARRSRTSPRRTSPAVAARPSRWTSPRASSTRKEDEGL